MEAEDFYGYNQEEKQGTKPVIRLEENISYQKWALRYIKDVPQNELEIILKVVLRIAELNTGSKFNEEALSSVIEMLQKDFNYLPVNFAASYILKGSLGKLGETTSKLTPRNIFSWLTEGSEDWLKMKKHREFEDKNIYIKDILKYPCGRAIIKKIEWYEKGLITLDDWDKIDIIRLAHDLTLTPSDFLNELK